MADIGITCPSADGGSNNLYVLRRSLLDAGRDIRCISAPLSGYIVRLPRGSGAGAASRSRLRCRQRAGGHRACRSFDEVIAIEPSHAQVTHAAQHERVRYVVAPAEQMDLDDASVDLIVCANAIHWFDLERFYPEARRVLRPDGVLAAWCYQRAAITPEIEEPIERYSRGTLDGYWSPRIAYVNEHYSTLPFPFDEIDAPAFVHEAELNLDELIGYLGSWSATRAYIERNAVDPLVALRAELVDVWGPGRRTVQWPLYMRIGKST